MSLILSEEEMDAMSPGNESDDDPTSTQMLEDIRDRTWSHTNVNRREAHYKIRSRIDNRLLFD